MNAYGFLSTYPPTQCGLATFTASMVRHLTAPGTGGRAGVVRVVDEPQGSLPTHVVTHLVNGARDGADLAAAALNKFDVAIIQHEYGIYGGRDGEDVLRVMAGLEVPAIVVLHTVLSQPSPHQRQVLERVADASDVVVVMSETAAHRLKEVYLVDPARVTVIPHGALGSASNISTLTADKLLGRRPTILTWGLIGPGKGIEWAIDAMAGLADLRLPPRYLVAGQTHPKVLEREGDSYRDSLRARAAANGVSDLVEFDARYRDAETLMALVRQADIVLLPYESSEQVTSGVLIEAVASRRPVVATDFPHARELLAGGAGLVVAHRDPDAMAAALRRILTERGLAASMTTAAGRISPSLEWSAVAARYARLTEALIGLRVGVAA